MEENQRDKLNKKLSFWQEVLKMIQLLSLYFFLYYSFSLIVAVFRLQGNTMRYVGILAYLVCGSVVFFLLPKDHRKLIPRVSGSETSGEKTDALSSLLLALSVIMIALGIAYFLNRLFAVIPWENVMPESAMYSSEDAFKIPLWVSLIGYGFLAPFAEEVAFRGILFKYLSKWMPAVPAILISAALFGLYHGNIMQGLYAFFMSMMMALMMYLTDSLGASVLFHMSANTLVTLYANIPEFYGFLMNVPGLILMSVSLVAGIVLLIVVKKRGKNP